MKNAYLYEVHITFCLRNFSNLKHIYINW